MDRFERFIIKRASKFAYANTQDTGQGIRKGIQKNQGIWDYLDQAETNTILYLYKFLDQNQDEEPRIKYKMKKGKLIPLTKDLTY